MPQEPESSGSPMHHHHSVINDDPVYHGHKTDHDNDGRHDDKLFDDYDFLYGPAHYDHTHHYD